MNNVIPFPVPGTKPQFAAVYHLNQYPRAGTIDSRAEDVDNLPEEIRAIEEELVKFTGPDALPTRGSYHVRDEDSDGDETATLEDLGSLDELVVFSPEIQRDDFLESVSREQPRPALWGDVFVKAGSEYRFVFTIYTQDYVRNQFLYFGEKIDPSPQDIILNREELLRADIIRAVIKWANVYCSAAGGKPISLEDGSVLKTLECDPPAELSFPESVL